MENTTKHIQPYDYLSRSVGAIVLNERLSTLLIFQQRNKYWEFPKGKMEKGERELDTLQREVYEETGITHFSLIEDFRRTMLYDFRYKGKLIRRKIIYFLIVTNDRVHISKEHTRYHWLSLEEAKKKLKHVNQVQVIEDIEKRVSVEAGLSIQRELVYRPTGFHAKKMR